MQPWSFPGPSERDVKYDTNEILCVPSAAVDTNFPSLSCWAGFDFVCLPLGPQPPLSSQLCVPQGWPLAISWFSCPCDPASDRKPLKGLMGFMRWGNTAHHEGHGLAVYIIGAVRRQKRPPMEGGAGLELIQGAPLKVLQLPKMVGNQNRGQAFQCRRLWRTFPINMQAMTSLSEEVSTRSLCQGTSSWL